MQIIAVSEPADIKPRLTGWHSHSCNSSDKASPKLSLGQENGVVLWCYFIIFLLVLIFTFKTKQLKK